MRIFEMRASIFVLVSSLSAETAMPMRRVGPVPKARWKSAVRLTRSRACPVLAGRKIRLLPSSFKYGVGNISPRL